MSKRDISDAQEVLKVAGLYSGNVDGLMGPKTREAIAKSESGNSIDKRWKEARRMIAAMQRELTKMGYELGKIDGLRGRMTESALARIRSESSTKPASKPALPVIITNDTAKIRTTVLPDFIIPRRRIHGDMVKTYGEPGDANRKNTAGKVRLPFPFVIAWNTSQKVSQFSAHEKAAPVFQSIFENAAKHYGEDAYRSLGLDLFGGCYNARKMRGGVSWSTHAWGVAVDLDPENNQLKWAKNRARFARPDYDAFWRIVEAHKCVSLGRQRDYDWMHFQLSRED